MAEWQKYRSHKIVQAAPIVRLVEHAGKTTLWIRSGDGDTVERFDPNLEGMAARANEGDYAIRYEDGYKSVSPKAVFEEGYTLVAGREVADGTVHPSSSPLMEQAETPRAYDRLLRNDEHAFRRMLGPFDLDAFADGVLAHRAGKGFHENPHGTNALTVARLSWSVGWNERALKQRD